MAMDKGMGNCLIPKEPVEGQQFGLPCGTQINEGDAIGTVMVGREPRVGHKRCADEFHMRKVQAERARNPYMVQKYTTTPGGAVDTSSPIPLVQGSIPLDRKKGVDPVPPTGEATIIGDMTQGATFLGDLPEDATPADAVQFAKTGEITSEADKPRLALVNDLEELREDLQAQPAQKAVSGNPFPQDQLPPGLKLPTPDQIKSMMPTVDAFGGTVTLAQPAPICQISPEDAEDLVAMINIQIKRARRQAE